MANNDTPSFLDGILKFSSLIADMIKQEDPAKTESESEQKPILLTADKIQELKWMTTRQLAAIFKYGKVPSKIDDDPEAYTELKWLTSSQLEAIFGKQEA